MTTWIFWTKNKNNKTKLNPKNEFLIYRYTFSHTKMPVITRSLTTSPTKTMSGVKRRFIEILDSDDDTTTVSTELASDSDSEFDPDIADVLEEEIEELKEELKDTEEASESLLKLLIKERENTEALRKELADVTHKYDMLISRVEEVQKTSWVEFVCFTALLAATAGTALAAVHMCVHPQFEY